jgi:uncharacterized membrane protein YqjE
MSERGLQSDSDAPSGLFGSLRALVATLIAIGHNRLELLSTEIQEEVQRIVSLLLWSVVAVLLGALGLLLVALAIVLSVDSAYRWLAAALVAALLFAGCLGAALVARNRVTLKPRPFDATLSELAKDHDTLSR